MREPISVFMRPLYAAPQRRYPRISTCSSLGEAHAHSLPHEQFPQPRAACINGILIAVQYLFLKLFVQVTHPFAYVLEAPAGHTTIGASANRPAKRHAAAHVKDRHQVRLTPALAVAKRMRRDLCAQVGREHLKRLSACCRVLGLRRPTHCVPPSAIPSVGCCLSPTLIHPASLSGVAP